MRETGEWRRMTIKDNEFMIEKLIESGVALEKKVQQERMRTNILKNQVDFLIKEIKKCVKQGGEQ